MIEFVYGALCHRAIIDSSTHNMSLIETFGRLKTTIHPTVADQTFGLDFPFVLASLWTNSGEEIQSGVVQASVQPPKGGELVLGEMPVEIKVGDTYKLRVNIPGIELRGAGWYRYILRFRGEYKSRFKRVATIPLLVIYNVQEDALMIDMSAKLQRDEEKD